MFDVGFSELVLCFLIALIVLGPERLPPLARSLGRWTGQARAYLRHLSSELERETNAAELKQQLEDARRALHEETQSAQSEMDKLTSTPITAAPDSTTATDAATANETKKS